MAPSIAKAIARFAPGVTTGYIAAAALAALLWLGVGLLLIPLMVVLAVLHGMAWTTTDAVVRSHHRWLARHHGLAAIALLAVTLAALFAVPAALHTGMTILNTLAYAPQPFATLAAAWPELDLIGPIALAVLAFAGWLIVTLWISIRLILRWLRWADRRMA